MPALCDSAGAPSLALRGKGPHLVSGEIPDHHKPGRDDLGKDIRHLRFSGEKHHKEIGKSKAHSGNERKRRCREFMGETRTKNMPAVECVRDDAARRKARESRWNGGDLRHLDEPNEESIVSARGKAADHYKRRKLANQVNHAPIWL